MKERSSIVIEIVNNVQMSVAMFTTLPLNVYSCGFHQVTPSNRLERPRMVHYINNMKCT